MPVFTSIFFVIALVMAVTVGAQTRSWTWGPAMLALGIATLSALPSFWKKDQKFGDFWMIVLGAIVAGWYAWRAWISPVHELGQADLLLLAGTVATYLCVRAIKDHKIAEAILIWGIVLLLLANIVVAGKQFYGTDYAAIFQIHIRPGIVTGFYSHYNEAANYFIASSMLVLAAGLFSKNHFAIRTLWILIAIAGLICVWFTHSRGGILGMALALCVFMAAALVIWKRGNSRWFAPMLIAIPVVGLGIGFYLISGWQNSQELRHSGSGIEQLFDNNARLYFLGIALSCIGLHPFIGGGSRSFSWESFRFVDAKAQGDIVTHKPEQVHNEFLQAATDYGLIGAGLLIILLGFLTAILIIKIFWEDRPKDRSASDDAWRIGALAALAGMLVQSSFSFVFHLFPGILLLGICLGQMAIAPRGKQNPKRLISSRTILSLAAVGCAVLLIPWGWKGTRVTQTLWAVYFGDQSTISAEMKIDQLSSAIARWPLSDFYQQRAMNFLALAELDSSPTAAIDAKENAIADYQAASRLHPFDPSFLINRANILSSLKRNSEAEADYAKGILLQGGMEPAFRGHLYSAIHYLTKGIELLKNREVSQSVTSLEIAAAQIETACEMMHWVTQDMIDVRITIHETLGASRDASGDFQGALESYDFASTFPYGNRAHYRAGTLLGKMADIAWKARRPEEAMALFIKARHRISITNNFPSGVSQIQRVEYLAYLDQTIAFLKAAKVTPLPDSDEN